MLEYTAKSIAIATTAMINLMLKSTDFPKKEIKTKVKQKETTKAVAFFSSFFSRFIAVRNYSEKKLY